jgi:hypothetical protein
VNGPLTSRTATTASATSNVSAQRADTHIRSRTGVRVAPTDTDIMIGTARNATIRCGVDQSATLGPMPTTSRRTRTPATSTLASSPNWLAATADNPPVSAPASPATTLDTDHSGTTTTATVAMVARQPGFSKMRTTRTTSDVTRSVPGTHRLRGQPKGQRAVKPTLGT